MLCSSGNDRNGWLWRPTTGAVVPWWSVVVVGAPCRAGEHTVLSSPVVLLTSYASTVCCRSGSVGSVTLEVAVDLECSCAVTWTALARVYCQRAV